MRERLVKPRQFGAFRDVGDPVASSKVYSSQDADELIFLNIEREARTIRPLLKIIERVSEVCFMPLTLGGGITSIADVETLIRNGADKVVINSAVFRDRSVVAAASARFGAQAVVVAVDVKRGESGFELYSDCGRRKESVSLAEHVAAVAEAGAGEILINSIDRDGMMDGYDLELIRTVKSLATVPVIGCGGAGTYAHMKDAFLETGADALACGSLFNFGDNNPLRAKAFLSNYGLRFKVV